MICSSCSHFHIRSLAFRLVIIFRSKFRTGNEVCAHLSAYCTSNNPHVFPYKHLSQLTFRWTSPGKLRWLHLCLNANWHWIVATVSKSCYHLCGWKSKQEPCQERRISRRTCYRVTIVGAQEHRSRHLGALSLSKIRRWITLALPRSTPWSSGLLIACAGGEYAGWWG